MPTAFDPLFRLPGFEQRGAVCSAIHVPTEAMFLLRCLNTWLYACKCEDLSPATQFLLLPVCQNLTMNQTVLSNPFHFFTLIQILKLNLI